MANGIKEKYEEHKEKIKKKWEDQKDKKMLLACIIFIFFISLILWKLFDNLWIAIPIGLSMSLFALIWFDLFGIAGKIFPSDFTPIKKLIYTGNLCAFLVITFTLGTSANYNQISRKNSLDERFRSGTELLSKEKFYPNLSGISILKEVAKEANKGGSEEKKYVEKICKILCIFIQDYSSDFKEKGKMGNESDEYKRIVVFQEIVDALSDPVFKKNRLLLSRADLRNLERLGSLNLKEADLKNADLKWADLKWADLTGADLTNADLSYHKSLNGANFSHAILNGANFHFADISGVNFEKSDLSNANLIQTNMRNTNFKDAIMYYAKVHHINLNKVNEHTNFEGAMLNHAEVSSRILGAKNINIDSTTIVLNQ